MYTKISLFFETRMNKKNAYKEHYIKLKYSINKDPILYLMNKKSRSVNHDIILKMLSNKITIPKGILKILISRTINRSFNSLLL